MLSTEPALLVLIDGEPRLQKIEDNMKKTNDTLGHAAGDQLLKNTVRVLKNTFRSSELIARIGGDEFTILLPKTDNDTGEQILSRIRQNIAEYNTTNPELPIGLSIGLATAKTSESLMETLTSADQRMYKDKAIRKSSKR